GRFTEALAKAKTADGFPGRPPELAPIIHQMIVAYAVAAKDYSSALAELDEMAAAGEGNQEFIGRQRAQLKLFLSRRESPAPPPPPTPAMPTTSHAVTADDYPPDSIRLREQGAVAVKY